MSTIDPRLLKAGGMEKATGWLAPILQYLGQMNKPTAQAEASTKPKQPGQVTSFIDPRMYGGTPQKGVMY